MFDKIENIIVAITNKCNLRCKMCNIWNESEKIDLDLNIFKKIFDSKHLSKDLTLTITGGEPFLSSEFYNIVELIVKERPLALRTISTNGVLTNKIIDFLERYSDKLPNLSLSVSFDGINKNDIQRGKSKSKIYETIKEVKERFPNLNLKLKFTITPLNYTDLIPTYVYCKSVKARFKVKLAESAETYTNKLNPWKPVWSKNMKNKLINDLVKIREEIIGTDKKNADFIIRTIHSLNDRFHLKKCRAPFERIFIMPDASIYSCIHLEKLGNLKDSSLDELYHSKVAQINRWKAEKKACRGCVSFHGGS